MHCFAAPEINLKPKYKNLNTKKTLEIKNYPIETILSYNGIRLQVVKAIDRCRGCYFNNKRIKCPLSVGACTPPWRDDLVIFRKVDKNKQENLHKRYGKKQL